MFQLGHVAAGGLSEAGLGFGQNCCRVGAGNNSLNFCISTVQYVFFVTITSTGLYIFFPYETVVTLSALCFFILQILYYLW